VSRVSRMWTAEDAAALRRLHAEARAGSLTTPVAQLRWERLMGQRARAYRAMYGPRKAFRRSL
jgi:hypothetical protein